MAGLRAVVVCGSTGEAAALTDEERVALVRAVRLACPDVPVVAGASAEWWRPAADRATAAVKEGADAVLVAPPRGGADLIDYFGHIADAAGSAHVLAYHFPPTAGGSVPVEALPSLPIHGIKDSSGDPERLLSELELDGWSGSTYVGSAPIIGIRRRPRRHRRDPGRSQPRPRRLRRGVGRLTSAPNGDCWAPTAPVATVFRTVSRPPWPPASEH